jgi:hypothetical protein
VLIIFYDFLSFDLDKISKYLKRMPAKDKKKSEAAAAKKDPSQISAELTKTKAKKCLMVNYGDVSERKNILKEIKKLLICFLLFHFVLISNHDHILLCLEISQAQK